MLRVSSYSTQSRRWQCPKPRRGGTRTHDLMRHFQGLVERTVNRPIKDGRSGVLPNFATEPFASVCERLQNNPDRAYLIGCGVALHIGPGKSWGEKLGLLLDLADTMPEGEVRSIALHVLEQPLIEIVGPRSALSDVVGHDPDLGPAIAALTRLAGGEAADSLLSLDPNLAAAMSTLKGPAARLALWLDGPHFGGVREAISKRVLKELNGPCRLRPSDPEGELKSLRVMATALTATAGRVLKIADIQDVFAQRSKRLTANDFVDSLTRDCPTARHQAEALIRLAENVTGGVAKLQAAHWLASIFGANRFEKEFRNPAEPPTARMTLLARLQRGIMRARLTDEDSQSLIVLLGEIGGAGTFARTGGYAAEPGQHPDQWASYFERNLRCFEVFTRPTLTR
jgi:hypothetical protein